MGRVRMCEWQNGEVENAKGEVCIEGRMLKYKNGRGKDAQRGKNGKMMECIEQLWLRTHKKLVVTSAI